MYVLFILHIFFFFKQKTAYEMRISDWSSDVCSSDLKIKDSTVSSTFQEMASGKTSMFLGLYSLSMRAMVQDHDAFPAGEFRAAYDTLLEMQPSPSKDLVMLGDRPISVTVARFWR